MKKKCQIIILPTTEKSKLVLSFKEKSFNQLTEPKLTLIEESNYQLSNIQSQHLYILSDEEIKEGDYILYNIHCCDNLNDFDTINEQAIITRYNKVVHPNIRYCKKIVASTGKLNINPNIADAYRTANCLPQIPQSFVEYFVSEYNKGNLITEVMVEYNECGPIGVKGLEYELWGGLKVNSKDNTITIKKVKDSWSRDEIKQILVDYSNDLLNQRYKGNTAQVINKWIEENL